MPSSALPFLGHPLLEMVGENHSTWIPQQAIWHGRALVTVVFGGSVVFRGCVLQ